MHPDVKLWLVTSSPREEFREGPQTQNNLSTVLANFRDSTKSSSLSKVTILPIKREGRGGWGAAILDKNRKSATDYADDTDLFWTTN